MSTDHDAAQTVVEADDLRRAYLEGKYRPDFGYIADLATERTTKLRQSFRHAFIWVACSTLLSSCLGLACQWYSGVCAQWLSSVLQLVGVAVILWAMIWELGWDVRSMEGHTLPERVHQWVFRLMYAAGSSLFFLAYVWGTKWAV